MLQPWQSQHVSVQPMLHHTVAQAQLDLVLRTEKRGKPSCISRWPYRGADIECSIAERTWENYNTWLPMLPIWLNLPLGFLTVPTTCCKCSCLSIFYMHDLAYACLLSLQCTPLQFVLSLWPSHIHTIWRKRSLHSSCLLNICLLLSC